jgi:hypothetical protein
LKKEAAKALKWMEYQSPEDLVVVAQQPTSDWRDEQWVCGFGLYTNALLYTCLRLYGQDERANTLRRLMNGLYVQGARPRIEGREGLLSQGKPYYATWAYKMYGDERFDLLGNSLAILSGIAPLSRARKIVTYAEARCDALRREGALALDLPPCLFPYILPSDPDWRERYERFNRPGDYHNGGVWPFVCGFYVAALVAAGRFGLARRKLMALTSLVKPSRAAKVGWGFNEWFNARDGTPQGQDWQSWSAAMYLYAAACVEQERTPFFEKVRRGDVIRKRDQ